MAFWVGTLLHTDGLTNRKLEKRWRKAWQVMGGYMWRGVDIGEERDGYT